MHEWNPEDIQKCGDMNAECTEAALMIRRCGSCSTLFAPPVTRCSACRCDDYEHVPATGSGSIVCWRMVTCAPGAEPAKSMIAIVELDEGPWVYTMIDGEPPRAGRRPVRVRFQAPPRGDRFPVFAINAPQAVPVE